MKPRHRCIQTYSCKTHTDREILMQSLLISTAEAGLWWSEVRGQRSERVWWRRPGVLLWVSQRSSWPSVRVTSARLLWSGRSTQTLSAPAEILRVSSPNPDRTTLRTDWRTPRSLGRPAEWSSVWCCSVDPDVQTSDRRSESPEEHGCLGAWWAELHVWWSRRERKVALSLDFLSGGWGERERLRSQSLLPEDSDPTLQLKMLWLFQPHKLTFHSICLSLRPILSNKNTFPTVLRILSYYMQNKTIMLQNQTFSWSVFIILAMHPIVYYKKW